MRHEDRNGRPIGIFDQRTAQIYHLSLDSAPSSSPAPSRPPPCSAIPNPMASLAITKLASTITPTNPWKPACQCACVSGGHGRESSALAAEAETEQAAVSEARPRFRWDAFGSEMSESQQRAVRGLSPKLPNRCKALVARVVCLCPGDESLGALLAYWVKAMKPKRADWLLVLKELKAMESPLLAEVSDSEASPFVSSVTTLNF